MLGPGRWHPLTKDEKFEVLDGFRSYLRVSNRASAGGDAMSKKCADMYVRVVDDITELAGLNDYGIDPKTRGLALYDGEQLSSGGVATAS